MHACECKSIDFLLDTIAIAICANADQQSEYFPNSIARRTPATQIECFRSSSIEKRKHAAQRQIQ